MGEKFGLKKLCYNGFIIDTGIGMIIEGINVEAIIKRVGEILESEQDLTPALKIEYLIYVPFVSLLLNRLGLKWHRLKKIDTKV